MRKSASRILLNVATLVVAVTSLQSAGFAQEVVFSDDFGDTTLGPEWVIDPGLGSYSLTSNPGFLTYNLDQRRMNSSDAPDDHAWPPSVGIEYPFEGTEWQVEVHVLWEIRYWTSPGSSTGAQIPRVNIRFADGSKLAVERKCDAWYSTNIQWVYYAVPGVSPHVSAYPPLAPGDVIVDDVWLRHDYWYQFERSGDTITMRYSFDGLTYDEGLTTQVSEGVDNTQTLVFDATCYNPYGSTAQWDYVTITDTANQPPIISCNSPVVLWSPNHELVDVSSAFSVTDPDGDDVTLSVRVISDESETPETGDGTGRHAPDFKDELLEGGRGLLVRSERRGPENGRFYIVVVEADDGNGGVSTAACIAAVCPHDQDEDSLADVLAQAAAGAAAVQDALDALPPPGLYEHGLSGELGPKQ